MSAGPRLLLSEAHQRRRLRLTSGQNIYRAAEVAFILAIVGLVRVPTGSTAESFEPSGIRGQGASHPETSVALMPTCLGVSLKLDVDVLKPSTEVAYVSRKVYPWVAELPLTHADTKSGGHFFTRFPGRATTHRRAATPGANMLYRFLGKQRFFIWATTCREITIQHLHIPDA